YDVVFHADGFSTGDEIAQDRGLLERTWIGVAQVISGARPAELRDHDALSRKGVAQQTVEIDRLIDCLVGGKILPVGQHVGRYEIDVAGQLRIVAPDVPDLAGRDRHVDRFFDPLDQLDEIVDLLLAAVDGFVSDNDADDVAVLAGERDRGVYLALVAVVVFVDPGADRHLESELGGDRRHELDTACRRVQADRSRNGRELFHIGANLLRGRYIIDVGMGRALEWCVGDARQDAREVRSLLRLLENTPQRRMSGAYKQQNSDDGAHRQNPRGHRGRERTRPLGSTDATVSKKFLRYACHAISQLVWRHGVFRARQLTAETCNHWRVGSFPVGRDYFAGGCEGAGCGEGAAAGADEPEVVAGAAAAAACG